jgi:hypothetical protein
VDLSFLVVRSSASQEFQNTPQPNDRRWLWASSVLNTTSPLSPPSKVPMYQGDSLGQVGYLPTFYSRITTILCWKSCECISLFKKFFREVYSHDVKPGT